VPCPCPATPGQQKRILHKKDSHFIVKNFDAGVKNPGFEVENSGVGVINPGDGVLNADIGVLNSENWIKKTPASAS
jgi:hypothetical protein